MRRKIICKIFLAVFCVGLLVTASIYLIRMYIDRRIDLTTAYIANHDLLPRTMIAEEDIDSIKVPSAYLRKHTVTDRKDIIGKYTDIQGKIPAGSLFYEGMLYDAEKMPDHPASQLRKGQACFVLETDIADLGSLVAGERVDLHITIERREDVPITGILMAGARVLSVKDHQGVDVNDEESTGIPYLSEIAVGKDDIDFLNFAESMGRIRLVVSSDSYRTDTEGTIVEDSAAVAYLKQLQIRSMMT